MTGTDIAICCADALSSDRLAALWNRAYEHYVVPVHFDEERLARHLRRAQVVLAQSRVLMVDGQPAGVALMGRREARAYLAGFGIVSAQRRRGLARTLIEAQLSALPPHGVREMVLEVIEQNPARAVYSQAGFEAQRPLELLEGVLTRRRATAETLAPDALAAVHLRCNAIARPTWRRELPTVMDAIVHENAVAIGVRRGTAIGAYAVLPAEGRHDGTLLDAAAVDETAAHALLDALSHLRPKTRWRLVDEPGDSPFGRAAKERGMVCALRQIEMKRVLPFAPPARDDGRCAPLKSGECAASRSSSPPP